MARSSKPIVWGPFAAGGTLTAFLTPVLIVLTLLAALGHAPDLLTFERLHAFAGHWLVKVAVAGQARESLPALPFLAARPEEHRADEHHDSDGHEKRRPLRVSLHDHAPVDGDDS